MPFPGKEAFSAKQTVLVLQISFRKLELGWDKPLQNDQFYSWTAYNF